MKIPRSKAAQAGFSLCLLVQLCCAGYPKKFAALFRAHSFRRKITSIANFGIIGDEILEQTIKKSKMMKKAYEGSNPQPIKIIMFGSESGGEYTLAEIKKMEYATRVNVWENVYTIFDDYVLIASTNK